MPQASPGTPLANPDHPRAPTAEIPSAGPPVEVYSEILKLEHQLIRVPYEEMKRTIRTTSKSVEKDVATVMAGVSEASQKQMSKEEAEEQIESWMQRLQGLKRKLEESQQSGQDQSQRCRSRLGHMAALTTCSPTEQVQWNKVRVERFVCDYLLRNGYNKSAAQLAEISRIKDLVDTTVFAELNQVLSALKQMDCGPALAWCNENKSRLKKNKSPLEFSLRLAEFVELVRSNHLLKAVEHARRHLAAWGSSGHMDELQRAMAMLVFKPTTDCPRYKEVFDSKQWEVLEGQFSGEFLKLYGMTPRSLLEIHLQAGLSALKTPFAYLPDCNKEDPLYNEAFRTLAEPLPFSKHIRSQLVCWMSKEPMDDHNPPMVLPTGLAYSKRALEAMAAKQNGKIVCPRTRIAFDISQVKKAYVF